MGHVHPLEMGLRGRPEQLCAGSAQVARGMGEREEKQGEIGQNGLDAWFAPNGLDTGETKRYPFAPFADKRSKARVKRVIGRVSVQSAGLACA